MKRNLLGVLALGGCLVAAPAGAWTEAVCASPDGRVTCETAQMARMNDKAFHSLTLSMSEAKGAAPLIMLSIHDSGWAMPERLGVKAEVGVDDKDLLVYTAITRGNGIFISFGLADLDRLAGGNLLYVNLPSTSYRYDLSGSRAAIVELVNAYAAKTAATDPFAGPWNRFAPPPEGDPLAAFQPQP